MWVTSLKDISPEGTLEMVVALHVPTHKEDTQHWTMALTGAGRLTSVPVTNSPKIIEIEKPLVIAVANQKGGTGKTTTTINLAVALRRLGLRTLVVDMDQQANATSGLGVDSATAERTIYEVLHRDPKLRCGIEDAAVVSLRGGDFVLDVGEDISVGYLSHDARDVTLYLEESVTFRVLEPDAAVAHGAGATGLAGSRSSR